MSGNISGEDCITKESGFRWPSTMRTASARLLIMVLKIGPNRGPLPFRFGSHIWVGQPLNRPWTSRIDGQTDKPIDPPDFRRTERFKRFFFFFFLFPSLKKGVILTLKLIPSQTFAASHHCHLFRLQSYDIIGPTMMSSPSRWCHHHPTMTPLSLSFDSSPAMSSTPRRCCYHPNMPLPSDDDTIPTATITYNVESCQFVINNNLINKL